MRVFAALFTVLLAATAAAAATCPPNSIEIGRHETAKEIRITCRCADRLWLIDGECVPNESRRMFLAAKFELEDAVLGALGKAVDGLDAIQAHVADKRWPAAVRNHVLLATLRAARARFARAREHLELVWFGIKDDDIARLFDDILTVRIAKATVRREAGPLVQERLDLATVSRLKTESQRLIIEASIALGEGRYEDAEARYQAARLEAAKAGDQEIHRAADDAAVWARSLRAARDEKLAPGRRDAEYRLARERAAAEHAWDLALKLGEAGERDKALALYDRAAQGFSAVGSTRMVDVTTKQKRELAAAPPGPSHSRLYRSFDHHASVTRATLVLDAVEYGKGDWGQSLDYLRLLMVGDPTNTKYAEALDYVRMLAATR